MLDAPVKSDKGVKRSLRKVLLAAETAATAKCMLVHVEKSEHECISSSLLLQDNVLLLSCSPSLAMMGHCFF